MIRFLVIGTSAAAVHMLVVIALVRMLGWPPLAANVAGWLTAFGVSFGGHYGWTFRGGRLTASASARRFFVLSAGGFLVNEVAYAVALRWSPLRFDILLAIVLVAVAVATFVLSRVWAFPSQTGPL